MASWYTAVMNRMWYGLALIGVAVVVGGGYVFYQYAKYTPPTWIIELATASRPPPPLPDGIAAPLVVPPGFAATIYSRNTPGARALTRDNKGAMLVTLMSEGRVVALPDTNSDGVAEEPVTVLSGLKQPHGIVEHCTQADTCTLYVAETDVLKAYAYNADTFSATYTKTLATFPTGSGHFTRTLQLSPDGKHLYVSIGSSCNVCVEDSPLRASIQEISLETGTMTPVATGLRNSVFMAIDPVQGKLWATENGRDLIGDDMPPDEVNIIERGKTYGWPLCYGNRVHDTDFDSNSTDPCGATTPPQIELPAHGAALGLTFIPEEGWPAEMRNDLLVALHGSWNRSKPAGFKVVRMHLDPQTRKPIGAPIDFVTGFMPSDGTGIGSSIGRPVGVLAEPGGVLYVTDDRAGAVYKISMPPIL